MSQKVNQEVHSFVTTALQMVPIVVCDTELSSNTIRLYYSRLPILPHLKVPIVPTTKKVFFIIQSDKET